MNTAPDKTKMLTRPATSARLRQIAMQLRWRPLVYRRALQLVGVPPDAERWRQLAERFLLLFASLMICTGIAALFAYNWAELDRFVKFGAIEIGILGCVALAWYRGLDALSGQSALFGASALVGLLLAVYGQTYQTGADPYGLFLSWALLILGWAIIGRQPGIWMLMVILANLSFDSELGAGAVPAGELCRGFGNGIGAAGPADRGIQRFSSGAIGLCVECGHPDPVGVVCRVCHLDAGSLVPAPGGHSGVVGHCRHHADSDLWWSRQPVALAALHGSGLVRGLCSGMPLVLSKASL